MPPKPVAPLTPAQDTLISLFSTFSVSAPKAEDIVRNPKQAAIFSDLAPALALPEYSWNEEKGKLLLVLIAQGVKLDVAGRVRVATKIGEGVFGRSDQILGESVCYELAKGRLRQAEKANVRGSSC